jgi:hypothetical protein
LISFPASAASRLGCSYGALSGLFKGDFDILLGIPDIPGRLEGDFDILLGLPDIILRALGVTALFVSGSFIVPFCDIIASVDG